MGSGASKQVGKVASSASRRQYPATSSIVNSPSAQAPPRETRASEPAEPFPSSISAPATDTKSQHVDLDARDPHFGAALRQLGQATPASLGTQSKGAFPTSSQPPVGQQGRNIFPSGGSGQNQSLKIVQTRENIAQRYEQEAEGLGRSSFAGRTLISAQDIREALRLRDEVGRPSQEVEKQMRLKPGLLSQLATKGVIGNA